MTDRHRLMPAYSARTKDVPPLTNPAYGVDLNRRIDEQNRAEGKPPATDWRTRVNDAYWLGWRDSQEAMRESGRHSELLAQKGRRPWWKRLFR